MTVALNAFLLKALSLQNPRLILLRRRLSAILFGHDICTPILLDTATLWQHPKDRGLVVLHKETPSVSLTTKPYSVSFVIVYCSLQPPLG